MEIIYGCECAPCGVHYGEDAAKVPVTFLIERDGKELKVCTRCDISGDKYIARLFDAHTIMGPLVEYDALGLFCIAHLVDDKEWNTFVAERNAIK